jgi:hypothetical protein
VLPVDPALVQLFLSVPLLDASRARTELQWSATHDSASALRSFADGLAGGDGRSGPLEHDSVAGRVRELRTLVGRRDPVIMAS